MCFVPLYFWGTYYTMVVLAHPLNIILHSKTHLIYTFSGRASLGPTGRRTYSTRETPALSDRTGFKEGGTKKRVRKNKGKEESVVVPQNLILRSYFRHLTFTHRVH